MKKSILYLLLVFGITSCDSVTSKLEEKQRLLDGKLNQLDSAINAEVKRVTELDTLISKEKAILDSILNIEKKLLKTP
jgi:hypothetical protein